MTPEQTALLCSLTTELSSAGADESVLLSPRQARLLAGLLGRLTSPPQPEGSLASYFLLLRRAALASENVDQYDLRSDDEYSLADFRALQAEEALISNALLDYARTHAFHVPALVCGWAQAGRSTYK